MRLSDNEDESNIYNLKFNFQFNESLLAQLQIKLPVQYESNLISTMDNLDPKVPTHFDDLVSFDPIESSEFEISNYKKLNLPQVQNYDPIEADKIARPGCEYESILLQRRGEP